MDIDAPISTIMMTDVITITPDAKFSEIREIFINHHFNHLPVLKDGKIVGILSSSEIIRVTRDKNLVKADNPQLDAILDHAFDVKEVMRTDPVTITENTTIKEAATILAYAHFHSLPVINDNAHLIGMVTSKDLIGYLLKE